jgi:thiol-disulfide isomerase/thioredoxin
MGLLSRQLGLRTGLVLAALFAVAMLGLAFGLTRPAASAPKRADAILPPSKRRAAPSLAGGRVIIGPALALERFRGRVLFVNFWASWCVPCRKEAPELARFAASLKPGQAALVGIDINDNRSDALAFIHRYGLHYADSADPGLTLFHRYDAVGIPTTFVIDARSRIAAQLIGAQTARSLSALLRRVMRQPA